MLDPVHWNGSRTELRSHAKKVVIQERIQAQNRSENTTVHTDIESFVDRFRTVPRSLQKGFRHRVNEVCVVDLETSHAVSSLVPIFELRGRYGSEIPCWRPQRFILLPRFAHRLCDRYYIHDTHSFFLIIVVLLTCTGIIF